ncbi:MAG: response regulator [Candidatus Hodarchaeales archaeon]
MNLQENRSERREIHVLCIDDNKEFVTLIGQYLEEESSGRIKTETVLSAIHALALLEIYNFDVVVSDYQMPEMNGLELLKELRKQGNTIPFIIMTEEEIESQALKLGASFYLQKGLKDNKVLFSELKRYILLKKTL